MRKVGSTTTPPQLPAPAPASIPAPASAPRPPVAAPPPAARQSAAFTEPWWSLVVEARRAVERIRLASARAQGPSASRIAAALGEGSVAADSAWHVATRARDIEAALRAMRLEAIEQRLAALEASGGDPADVEAVRRSLAVQQEAAARMRSSLTGLLGQLERLVAQLCEAATYADELALGVPEPGDRAPGLTSAIDGLAAIRAALDVVDTAAS
jgi:hypothetical protein